MNTTYDQRRALYEGARTTWSAEASAALVEAVSLDGGATGGTSDRLALRRELAVLEQSVLAARSLERWRWHLRWVAILCPVAVLVALVATAPLR